MNDDYKEIVNDCLEHAKNQNGEIFGSEDDEVIKHYNDNHDPKTGQFAPKVNPSDISSVTTNLGNIVDPKKQQGKKKYASYPELTDDQLNKAVNRLSKEHQLSDLKDDTKEVLSGRQKAREVIEIVGSIAALGLTIAKIVEATTPKK